MGVSVKARCLTAEKYLRQLLESVSIIERELNDEDPRVLTLRLKAAEIRGYLSVVSPPID